MKQEFVTYKIAKHLKEIGFNEPCFATYGFNGENKEELFLPQDIKEKYKEDICYGDFVNAHNGEDVAAPLWQQVVRWLTKEHNTTVCVVPTYNAKLGKIKWSFCFPEILNEYNWIYDSYEEALEQGILEAFDII